jgi:23S rRNA (guanine745-N1)-methyltransferase
VNGPGVSEAAARPVTLLCTVRGCGQQLRLGDRDCACPRGHHFDRARSGYWNLLQPQDRRSLNAGDSAAAARARRRLFDAGHDAPLVRAVAEALDSLGIAAGDAAVLDIGCGEGSLLAALLGGHSGSAHGIDLSVPAIELAARRQPAATWVVANADRFLPYANGTFQALLSLTARRPAAEMRRVLADDGRLLVAVPAADDLIELRAALQGDGLREERLPRLIAELAAHFALSDHRTVRWTARLDHDSLRDVLATTYRGARAAERRRFAELDGLALTMSRELAVFRPRARAELAAAAAGA